MKYNSEEKRKHSFRKTDGRCHLCHGKVVYKNYGKRGERGAWVIDHSVARATGGSHRLQNLMPAHYNCNEEKGTMRSRTIRKRNGKTRAPRSMAKKNRARNENTAKGALIGGTVGMFLGPEGALLGSAIGAAIGRSISVE